LTDPVIRRVVYLIAAGGKRLRPALVLLGGAAGPSPNRPALIDTAAAVELIHTATLIHDDIIDQSPLRRSQPAFHHRWGTERAVLMGDYLYATAFRLVSRLRLPYLTDVLSDVCQQLCRGELREVEARERTDVTEAEYFAIVDDKTASLIRGCCASGAYLGGCPRQTARRLIAFGVNFGLAFQIIDDCLDLTGDHRQLGKAVLRDVDKGTLSLPIIYLAQTMSHSRRRRFFAPVRRRPSDPMALVKVAAHAQACGAIAKAQARAADLIRTALTALAHTPMNGLADAYTQLATYALSRRH
jgi:geranylgeranyl pyrophosphate synthase